MAQDREKLPLGTVLVIEDDPADAREIIASLRDLSDGRYRLIHAESLADGLDHLAAGPVELAFVDLSMTGGHNLEPLEKIKQLDPALPVVVLSSLDDKALAVEAVRRGAQDCLVKGRINPGVIVRVARYAVERNRILSRLRQLDRLKSKFVSTVSHEMRTPLAIIREFVALVRDGIPGEVNADQQECLDSALRNCDRLTTLIEDLLDLSQIEAGKLKLCRVRTDLAAILMQCAEDFLPKCSTKGQLLELEASDALPPVLCDPDKILQVLVNLVGNAHKFSENHALIVLRATETEAGVRVDVQDDGAGISAEDQRKIFEAFTQLGRRDGPGAQGTGLGLTISHSIVELHGGALSVDSKPGEGSCFSFHLPRYHDGDELPAFFEDRLRVYASGHKPACFLFVRSCGGAGPEALARLETVRECALETMRSSRDETLLVKSESLLVGLIEADVPGARMALRRLRDALRAKRIEDVEFGLAPIQDVAGEGVDPHGLEYRRFDTLAAPAAPHRIMIVDDDETVLGYIEAALATVHGAKTLATTSGYEACIRFERFEPDLVILDVQMPGMDGPRVLSSMKQAGSKKTKFLAVSGDPDRLDEMVRNGCDDYLAKPFDPDALVRKVTSVLDTEKENCDA